MLVKGQAEIANVIIVVDSRFVFFVITFAIISNTFSERIKLSSEKALQSSSSIMEPSF